MAIQLGFPEKVDLVEVGPRDGLQNEQGTITTDLKLELCDFLIRAGVRRLEAGAFVSPKWVPQMADSSRLLERLNEKYPVRGRSVHISALVPNLKGLEAAVHAGVNEIVVFTSASETFAQKNINCSIQDSLLRFKPVVNMALEAGMHVRGSISCALGCPYQGMVPTGSAAEVAKRLEDLGVTEFDVADTTGVGTFGKVQQVFDLAAHAVGVNRLAGHFHDTYGQAVANVVAALEVGVSTFHSAIAGLGGCPYAKGATGNVATEDLVYLLAGLGVETGLDLAALTQVGQWISRGLGRPYTCRAGLALSNRESIN